MSKARRAVTAVLVFSVLAALAVPASAQAASITVSQTCINPGGQVSGSYSGAPTDSRWHPQGFVSADHSADMTPGQSWGHSGGQSVTADAEGAGTFSFTVSSSLPDRLWVKLRFTDLTVAPHGLWTPFAAVGVWVCGREDTDGDGVRDSVDNCPTFSNLDQFDQDGDGIGDICDPTPTPESIYDFDGFYNPVENRDAGGTLILNRVQAGSAVPLKFRLGGDYGLDVFADGYPKSETIACDSTAEVNGIDQTVNAGQSSLRYDAVTGIYTYVWKTNAAWADTCRQLVVRFDDGHTTRANFLLK